MEMLGKIKSGYEGLMSSMSELGALQVSYMEKVAEKQIASAKYVSDLGFTHMKSLVNVDSLEAAKTIPSSTMELGTQLARKTMEDTKAFVEIGSGYKSDVTAIFKKAENESA